MIEIKITIDSALQLLLERMRYELNMRQKANKNLLHYQLDELSFKELQSIVKSSVFDTIFLLPLDITLIESNLVNIVGSTVRALSKVFRQEEFLLFSDTKAGQLVNPILNHIKAQVKAEKFFQN